MNDIKQILFARGKEYGTYKDVADTSQALKDEIRGHLKWQLLTNDKKESLDLICNKIARLLNGNQNHLDSWVDIQGYAKLISDELEAE